MFTQAVAVDFAPALVRRPCPSHRAVNEHRSLFMKIKSAALCPTYVTILSLGSFVLFRCIQRNMEFEGRWAMQDEVMSKKKESQTAQSGVKWWWLFTEILALRYHRVFSHRGVNNI
jgi:hypothetical protein